MPRPTNNARLSTLQKIYEELIYKLEYPQSRIKRDVRIKMGSSGYARQNADIVVYPQDLDTNPLLVVISKPQDRRDGIRVLQGFMRVTDAKYGLWTNGLITVIQSHATSGGFKTIPSLPSFRDLQEQKSSFNIRRSDLIPVAYLDSIIEEIEDHIMAHQGGDVFKELFKLIFAKLYDEKRNLKNDDSIPEFRVNPLESLEDIRKRIISLFDEAKHKWDSVFLENERLELIDENLIYAVSSLQFNYLIKTDADVLGHTFERMVNPDTKAEKGQYFTPRQVVKMCIAILNPRDNESIYDPACGSGGFLIHAMDHVFNQIETERDNLNEIVEAKKDYAQENIFGTDYDNRLVTVAKAQMLIWGDGRGHIFQKDSLDIKSLSKSRERIPNEFDIVVTNPPFAGQVKTPSILSQYDLAFKGDPHLNPMLYSQSRPILFLERCIKALKPRGRMAIVLPHGILCNKSLEYVRTYMLNHCRLLGVVGLDTMMFRPFTVPQPDVVFLQKKAKLSDWRNDYSIFFAVSEKSGKLSNGKPLWVKADKFEEKQDWAVYREKNNIKQYLNTDLSTIAVRFREFLKNEGVY